MADGISLALTGVAWLVTLIVAVPLAIFTIEILAGLLPGGTSPRNISAKQCTVLIPAHNEALGIAATLQALRAVAPADVKILVVADNCSDDTADVARANGAEVIERSDATARGKGFALAYGRDHLAKTEPQPDVVIVLDADCRLAPGSIEALIAACSERPDAPAQAVNLISPELDASPMVQISGFAMVVKNLYRSRGMQRLGGPALLTGTGMAFPWELFARADLASGSIVEDLGLGIALTRAGHAPRLITEAQVSSAPAPPAVALVQRTRWEHGFLHTLRSSALSLIGSGITRQSLSDLLLGFHLIVPPLALLLTLSAVALSILAILALVGAGLAPLIFLSAMLAAALITVFLAWLAGGRRWLSGAALLRAPLYILWKLPIYLRFFRRPETEWQRTPREGE